MFWVNCIILIIFFFIILVFFVALFLLFYLRLLWWDLSLLWWLGWMSLIFSNFAQEGNSILRAIHRNSGAELTFLNLRNIFFILVDFSDSCLSDLACLGRFFMLEVNIVTLFFYQLCFLTILLLFFLVWVMSLFFQFFILELLFSVLLNIICILLLRCHLIPPYYFLIIFWSSCILMIHMVLFLHLFLALLPDNTLDASHIFHICVKSINFKILFLHIKSNWSRLSSKASVDIWDFVYSFCGSIICLKLQILDITESFIFDLIINEGLSIHDNSCVVSSRLEELSEVLRRV